MLSPDISFLAQPESSITYTARMKHYPDGSWEVMAASRPVFREQGWELSDLSDSEPKEKRDNGAANIERSRRRAAARLRDYALCSPMRFFVTLTFSPEKVDRYDIKGILAKLRSWLDNRVRRKGLAYILVPELHKDGAIHFHGFFSDCDIGIVDSGTIDCEGWKHPKKPKSKAERERWLADGGRIVYNISDWAYGFTTAIELYGERAAAVGYCVKYVSKQKEKIGGRWYYSGGNLCTPKVTFGHWTYYDIIEADPGAFAFEIPAANVAFAIVRGKSEKLQLDRKS